MAFGGLISSCLAIATAFGLLFMFLPFTDMVSSVPFLALGEFREIDVIKKGDRRDDMRMMSLWVYVCIAWNK